MPASMIWVFEAIGWNGVPLVWTILDSQSTMIVF